MTVRLRLDAMTAEGRDRLEAALAEGAEVTERAESARAAAETAREAALAATAEAEAANAAREAEAARARDARETAREAETRDAARRAALAAEQAVVIEALRLALARIAEQDLSAPLDAPFAEDYEPLRRDYNDALGALRDAVAVVVEIAGRVGADTTSLGDTVTALTGRIERQAETLETTAAALSAVVAGVATTAEGARRTDGRAREADAAARAAAQIVRRAGDGMAGLRASSDEIANIVDLIEEVSFQTSLLSLNAGIEAARAGPAGRGFAVVASEVGALARRSADAAGRIRELSERSRAQVTDGAALVDESVEALGRIGTQVADVLTDASDIATRRRGAVQAAQGHRGGDVVARRPDARERRDGAQRPRRGGHAGRRRAHPDEHDGRVPRRPGPRAGRPLGLNPGGPAGLSRPAWPRPAARRSARTRSRPRCTGSGRRPRGSGSSTAPRVGRERPHQRARVVAVPAQRDLRVGGAVEGEVGQQVHPAVGDLGGAGRLVVAGAAERAQAAMAPGERGRRGMAQREGRAQRGGFGEEGTTVHGSLLERWGLAPA